MQKTIILGGGVGGIVSSNVLKKAMGDLMQITVIDREANHYYSSSFPLLMIGERKTEDITRQLKDFRKKDIGFINNEIKVIDFENHQVITNEQILEYDYLIISLGMEYHPEMIPGFSEYALNAYQFTDVIKINESLNNFTAGKIVLFISSVPYKCPPAPYEMIFLMDQFFRKRGIRNKVELILVTPEYSPEPLAGPKVGQSVRKMMASKNIELITEAKILEVEKRALVLEHGTKITADLILGIAPHWTPEVLRNTDIVDKNGFVEIDIHTMETEYPGVYGIGDNAAVRLPIIGSYAPKAGIFAHYQGEVVARNIACIAKGLEPKFRYTGKGACIMNSGFGRARYSTVHYYKEPSPFITLLRPTAAAYWSKVAFEKYWLNRWL